jgi:parallel beta-helix repeat protein
LINIENIRAYFVISNCILNGLSKNFDGIVLSNVTNGFIDDNEIRNCSNGIKLTSTNRTTISENDVYYNKNDGINLTNSHYNNASFNSIYHNGANPQGNGIVLDPSNHNLISNNSVYNNSINGIYISRSINVTITNNTVYNNKKDGIFFENTNNSEIFNNSIQNNGGNPQGNGIVLDPSNHNRILNNTVYSNSINGMMINDSINATIMYNIISYNKLNGIFFENTNSSVISDNYIHHNGGNPQGNGIVLDPSSYNNVTNNILELNSIFGINITSEAFENRVEFNDFICNNLNNPSASQANDDGDNNTFNENYWSDHTDSTPYSIDGDAGSTDSSPNTTTIQYTGVIPCGTTTTTTSTTPDIITTDTTTTTTTEDKVPGLSFGILLSSVMALYFVIRKKKKGEFE